MSLVKISTALAVVLVVMVSAADDPSIRGAEREGVSKAMKKHIDEHQIDGKYIIYDAALNKLRTLKFEKLHDGIVKKGDFYVSCADFTDSDGLKYDLDFFVVKNDKSYKLIQSIVHKVNGDKRPYNLEN